MRQTYIDKKFTPAHEAVIAAANIILKDYSRQGFDITLRQLYYQFVARQPLGDTPFENSQRSYKRLGKIVSDARLAGRIDWRYIVDRTRSLRGLSTWDSPAEIIDGAAGGYRRDLWDDQPYHVEAWIEKDALVGVLERACNAERIDFFSCRGYTSQSELHAAGQRLKWKARDGKKVLVLHLGDHDPSGIDMTRDNDQRVSLFAESRGIEFRRIALNMDQVEALQPPPNPVKASDSRGTGYVDLFGDECWELDALDPPYIRALIETHVAGVRDRDLWDAALATEETEKAHLRLVAENWADVSQYVAEEFGGAEYE